MMTTAESTSLDWNSLADRVLAGGEVTRNEALSILTAPDDDVPAMIAAAFRIRLKHFGHKVHFYYLKNAKSGLCPEDCGYCSQNIDSEAEINRYPMLNERKLMEAGNDVYIVAGTSGTGGTGQNGYATTLAGGKLTVPATLWKILVIVPTGADNAFVVTENTRVIAVNIPNNQLAADKPWRAYVTSIDALESLTGYDFLSNVPTEIQRILEARIDGGNS